MLIFGQGTDDYILVMFQVTILGAGYNMWGNELLSGGLLPLNAFLAGFVQN